MDFGQIWADRLLLALCVLVLLVAELATCIISMQFVWGEGHTERPIIAVLLIQSFAFMGFCGAIYVCARRSARLSGGLVLLIAALLRITLLNSELIQEADCYRYVLDGMVFNLGRNPYELAPETLKSDASDYYGDVFSGADAQRVLARVGYPELRTVYPPLAQHFFALGAWLTPWDWFGQRIVFVSLDVILVGLILFALRAFGLPAYWAIFYAWNPLVLKEVSNSVHLDSLVALCVTALCITLMALARKRRVSLLILLGFLFACAVLAKIWPLIFAPVCAAALLRAGWRRGSIDGAIMLVACMVTALLVSAPFLDVPPALLVETLRVYAVEWVRNAGAFGLLNAFLPYPREISYALIAAFALIAAWRVYRCDVDQLPETVPAAMSAIALFWFLLQPAAFPWYAVTAIALGALRPGLWIVVLSGVFAFYYLLFYVEYHDLPAWHKQLIALVQHVPVWLAFGYWLCYGWRRKREELVCA